jgi:hypothetical protein
MEATASRRWVVSHLIDKMREVTEAPTSDSPSGRLVLSQNRKTPGNQGFFFVAGRIRRLAS